MEAPREYFDVADPCVADQVEDLRRAIREGQKIIGFFGAGVSTSAGRKFVPRSSFPCMR